MLEGLFRFEIGIRGKVELEFGLGDAVLRSRGVPLLVYSVASSLGVSLLFKLRASVRVKYFTVQKFFLVELIFFMDLLIFLLRLRILFLFMTQAIITRFSLLL